MCSKAFALLFLMLAIASASSSPLTYKASLSGAYVSPPVATKANGSVSITLVNKSYASGFFYATNINQMTMAHLHAGPVGKNGPATAWAFNASYGPISGSIKASFTFNPSQNNVSALLATRQVYFNIHTTAHPAGELRGQLTRSPRKVKGTSYSTLPDGSYKETCLSLDDVECETYLNSWTSTTWLSCVCFLNSYGVIDYIYSPQDLDLSTCAQPPYVYHDEITLSLTCPPVASPPPPPSPPSPPSPPPPLTCKYRGESCDSNADCCFYGVNSPAVPCPPKELCCQREGLFSPKKCVSGSKAPPPPA